MSSKPVVGRQAQTATMASVGSNALTGKGISAARIGLILLDSHLKPLYCNSEALKIFAYPNQAPEERNAEFSEWIRSIVWKKTGENELRSVTHFASGRRRYLCRSFVLELESKGEPKPTVAITLERRRTELLGQLEARFQLTNREIEAVRHLLDGLTSKEIAQRMNISANTVKSFLRLIMIKMGVTTRSGIIGKLISGDN